MTESLPVDLRSAHEYDAAARAASSVVIDKYSTSFGLASRLLGRTVRPHVRCVYALVRVADEIVDGAAAASGVSRSQTVELLNELEVETLTALERGFSTNLVVHAFARTAQHAGIGADLVVPFFASMRTDLTTLRHTEESVADYVYGSAEVIGLMCLRIFMTGNPVEADREARLQHGARCLGAAFQKINFLRDIAQDYRTLGRVYLPGTDPSTLTEAVKNHHLDRIDADLAVARAAVDDLPESSRTAVLLAHDLFAELAARLRSTPAEDLLDTRIRVPDTRKLVILGRSLATGTFGRGQSWGARSGESVPADSATVKEH